MLRNNVNRLLLQIGFLINLQRQEIGDCIGRIVNLKQWNGYRYSILISNQQVSYISDLLIFRNLMFKYIYESEATKASLVVINLLTSDETFQNSSTLPH